MNCQPGPVALTSHLSSFNLPPSVTNYALIIAQIAVEMRSELSTKTPLEKLIEAGREALLDAFARHEASDGMKFHQFATFAVRNGILKCIIVAEQRASDFLSAIDACENSLGASVTEQQVAEKLKITAAEYTAWLLELADPLKASGSVRGHNESGVQAFLHQIIPDVPQCDRSGLQANISNYIGGLGDDDQTILALYYYEELSLEEIGQIMNLPWRRVLQLKLHALLKLRAHLMRQYPRQRLFSGTCSLSNPVAASSIGKKFADLYVSRN